MSTNPHITTTSFEPVTSLDWHMALAREYDGALDLTDALPNKLSELASKRQVILDSYATFCWELRIQYNELTRNVDVIHTDVDPYETPQEMFADLRINSRLGVYRGNGPTNPNHPLNAIASGWDDLTYNDLFRAVHDYHGHYGGHNAPHYDFGLIAAANGGDGLIGEELAYQRHKAMFSDVSWMALTVETRCQTATNNLLPRIVETGGFIEQKVIWLPEWAYKV